MSSQNDEARRTRMLLGLILIALAVIVFVITR